MGIDDSVSKHPLRELLRFASVEGLSYRELGDHPRLADDWNENSLKQFAYRKGTPRADGKTKNLATVLIDFFEKRSDKYGSNEFIQKNLNGVKNETNIIAGISIFSIVDEAFDVLNENVLHLKLPNSFCFSRFDRSNKHIITMKIDIVKSVSGIAFIMKIYGKNERKRIVIGRVSGTALNTYLTGLAFTVSSQINLEEFEILDVSNEEMRKKVVSDNPLGVEHIAIANFSLYSTEFPVSFCGLDGAGLPISGIGVLFNEQVYSKYKIGNTLLSRIECKEYSSGIQELMYKTKCVTNFVITDY